MKTYLIASGKIAGTYADSFHNISEDGKIGYYLDRTPSDEERTLMLADLKRHRESLQNELDDLDRAEKLLQKL